MSKLNSPLFLFHAAKEFFENGTQYASKFFKTNDKEEIDTFDNFIHAKICVPATNISFALELALKGYLLHNGQKRQGHDLLKLFNQLESEFRNKILEHYFSHSFYKKFITIRLKDGGDNSHGSISKYYHKLNEEEYILWILEIHKLSFITFRYLNEFKKEEEWFYYFKEMSNFTFSTLFVLGKELGINVVHTIKRIKKS